MITGSLLVIDPTVADFENVSPSTTSLICEEVLMHCTVCQSPSSRAGPSWMLALFEPLKPQ